MKKKIYTILVAFTLLTFVSCQNELDKDVKLDVWVTSDGSSQIGDTIVVQKSEIVKFNFSGNPDFITFYSGESGKEYKNRDRTLIPEDEITSELKFTLLAQYGTIPNSFKVLLSTDFGELNGSNKSADSIKIESTAWVDVPFTAPASGKTVDLLIPMNNYLGKKLSVAFCYKPFADGANQPTWVVQNLEIKNTLKKDGSLTSLPAKDMGFTPLDMFALGNDAYKAGTGPGIWNLSKIATEMRMASSSATNPLNLDWLISKPLLLNACSPDRGTGIKEINATLENYTHQYHQTGVYVVTFVAKNANYAYSSQKVREIVLKVVE